MKFNRVLKDVLIGNPCLECLVLQNILLREEDIYILSKALPKVTTLKFLSFEQCPVRDKGFNHLMEGIRKAKTISSINFTKCALTWKSMEALASVIKYQSSQRHEVAWQASLRYRKPDLDQMHGLRRVALCQNKLGDEGGRILADALKDDIWLKALDLQQCGLSDDSATILMETLKWNKNLVVLDIRRNSFISYQNLRSLIEMVMVNAGGESSEYPWMKASEEIKSDTTFNKRSSTMVNKKQKRNGRRKSLESKRSKDHVPWRMAERVRSRYSNTDVAHSNAPYFTQKSAAGLSPPRDTDHPLYEWSDRRKEKAKRRKRVQKDLKEVLEVLEVEECIDEEDEIESESEEAPPEAHPQLSASHEEQAASDYLQTIEQLREELDDFRAELDEERSKRRKAEQRIEKLKHEKQVLKHTVEFYKHQSMVMEEEKQSAKKTSLNFKLPDLSPQDLLENENALASIESSFQQFQKFLDMLKNLGLDDVCQQFDQQPTSYQQQRQQDEKS
ncbi:centrosomal protein of 78 kDa-like isoform X2 [Clytia hemisphaerica]|uniref:centrosomal protein of 78 kDa-like isoform X2 n=1 Tax=Clytia hemisphaerica TaxID=252671 RepID=UPI0034D74D7E